MTMPVDEQQGMFARLKEWLRERKANYIDHNSWNGDTEGGFYSTDDFDFKKLCAEIDAFGEQLRSHPQPSPDAEEVFSRLWDDPNGRFSYLDRGEETACRSGWNAALQYLKSQPSGREGCICEGNWRSIVKETEHLIGRQYQDQFGQAWKFFGIVHGGDDYYYGMCLSFGEGTILLSCVGSIEGYGYELIAAASGGKL